MYCVVYSRYFANYTGRRLDVRIHRHKYEVKFSDNL